MDNQSNSGSPFEQRSSKKLKMHRVTNGFISSLRSTRREQRLNRNKIRIRYLPERPNEDTSELVIEILNYLDIHLTPSDIIFCERVTRWDGIPYPKDIVVTFVSTHTRDHVYFRRLSRSGLPFQIEEELGQERARIFTEAVGLFGESNVFNISGVVHVITRRKHRHEIRTMWEFRTFLRKISSEMRMVPYYKRDSSDRMYAVYASDSSEEQSSILYGPRRRGDRRLHKTLRIRNVPEINDENTKFEVIQYIYVNLNVDLDASDVQYCERVVGWDGCVEPRDIVVTFKYKHLQQNVLYNRKCLQDGRTKILEELTADMAEIWGQAVRTFGEDNVYIVANHLSINVDGTRHPVISLNDYKNLIKVHQK